MTIKQFAKDSIMYTIKVFKKGIKLFTYRYPDEEARSNDALRVAKENPEADQWEFGKDEGDQKK